MTALCSQRFIAADPSSAPVYPRSVASSLRSSRLLSRPTSFSRSTMECCQSSLSACVAARPFSTAATSTGAAGVADAAGASAVEGGGTAGASAGGAAAPPSVGGAGGVAASACPQIRDNRLLKSAMLVLSVIYKAVRGLERTRGRHVQGSPPGSP